MEEFKADILVPNKKRRFFFHLLLEFLLNSKEHLQLLREHVLNWYYQNINVIEDYNGGRSYGLEVLTYEERQEFKKYMNASKMPQP
jgi:hypothetical protein